MTEKDWMDFPCEGGITIDTKSAKSSLEEIAISVSGLHPMASVNWTGNAYRLREVSTLIDSMEVEINRLQDECLSLRLTIEGQREQAAVAKVAIESLRKRENSLLRQVQVINPLAR